MQGEVVGGVLYLARNAVIQVVLLEDEYESSQGIYIVYFILTFFNDIHHIHNLTVRVFTQLLNAFFKDWSLLITYKQTHFESGNRDA